MDDKDGGLALLLIDIQNDFIDGSLAVKDAKMILPTVRSLISLDGWQQIVASLDTHPASHVSFASTHNLDPFQTIQIAHPTLNRDEKEDGEMVDQMLWPDHCLEGSWGCQLENSVEKALEAKEKEQICKIARVKKGRSIKHDAYSAFSYNHYLSFSDLPRILFSHPSSTPSSTPSPPLIPKAGPKRISTLVLCGLATDYCLFSSAIDSVKFGFRTIVVLSGCRGVDVRNDGCQQEIQRMKDWGVIFKEVDEIRELLQG